MNRVFVLFLTFLYLVLSSGFTTSTHFCEGIKQKTTLFNSHNKNEQCPVCAAKNKNKTQQQKKDCCKHQTELVKIAEKAQQISQQHFTSGFAGDALPHRFFGAVFETYIRPAAHQQPLYTSSSIPIRSNPLYIFHCVYRI
jgi:hypothetical protein